MESVPIAAHEENAFLGLSEMDDTETEGDGLSVESNSVEYSDPHALLIDLERFLAQERNVGDAVAVVGPEQTEISVHTQLLTARSIYFATTFRPPWRTNRVYFPSFDPEIFRMVLDFLYTARVQLGSDSGEAVEVAALAHFLNISTLEQIAVRHIRSSVKPSNFPTYFRFAVGFDELEVPDIIMEIFVDLVFNDPMQVITSSAMFQATREDCSRCSDVSQTVIFCLWAVLVRYFASDYTVEPEGRTSVARAFLSWSSRCVTGGIWKSFSSESRYEADSPCLRKSTPSELKPVPEATPLAEILDSLRDSSDRSSFVTLLTDICPTFFSQQVEPLGILRKEEVLEKYRRDENPYTIHESVHPHPLTTTLSDRVYVELPSCASACNIRFDPRTSLSNGTELLFYAEDPIKDIAPVKRVMGPAPGEELVKQGMVLSLTRFWFALVCRDAMPQRPGWYWQGLWGFKFIVTPVYGPSTKRLKPVSPV